MQFCLFNTANNNLNMEDNNNRKRKHGDTCKRRKGSQGKNWTKNVRPFCT